MTVRSTAGAMAPTCGASITVAGLGVGAGVRVRRMTGVGAVTTEAGAAGPEKRPGREGCSLSRVATPPG